MSPSLDTVTVTSLLETFTLIFFVKWNYPHSMESFISYGLIFIPQIIKPFYFPLYRVTNFVFSVEQGGHRVVIALAQRDVVTCRLEKFVVSLVRDEVIHDGSFFSAGIAARIYCEEPGAVASPGGVSSVHCLLSVSLGVVFSGLEFPSSPPVSWDEVF